MFKQNIKSNQASNQNIIWAFLQVSEQGFDPEVYKQNIAANASNRTAQRARAWGSGNITAFKDQQQLKEEKEQHLQLPQQSPDEAVSQPY